MRSLEAQAQYLADAWDVDLLMDVGPMADKDNRDERETGSLTCVLA